MNLSSLVVYARKDQGEDVANQLQQCGECKYHIHENEKSIVTIEAEDAQEEMRKVRVIESIQGVLAAYIVYTYCEQELDQERDKLQKSPDYPDWLNNENLPAEKIPYHGTIKS